VTDGVNPMAARGFGAAAGAYDEARPTWPLEAIDAAFATWDLDPAAGLVVDVAAGTGRLTERLSHRCPHLLAVEPLDEMRALIGSAAAVAGTAERLPLDAGSATAIFVGEAFHWFDQPAALREFARVLAPGGGLAILWNHPLGDVSEQPWRAEVGELLLPIYSHPRGRGLGDPDPRDTPEWQAGPGWEPFASIEYREVEHAQPLTRAGFVTLVSSWSFVAALGEPERTSLLDRVDAILADHGVESFEQRWRCDVHLTRRV
jgi:SAM-dependent methyltransferase